MTSPRAATAPAGKDPSVGGASGSAGGNAPTASAIARALLLPAANEPTPPPGPPAVPSSLAPAASDPAAAPSPPAVPSSMIPAANEPIAALERRAAKQPPRAALGVQVEAAPQADRDRLVPVFWKCVGDLIAEVLLDDVGGSWGATETLHHENLSP